MPGLGLVFQDQHHRDTISKSSSNVVAAARNHHHHNHHQHKRKHHHHPARAGAEGGSREGSPAISFSNSTTTTNSNHANANSCCSSSSNHPFFFSASRGGGSGASSAALSTTSASASADRRSFGSDHDPRVHSRLAGGGRCSGPDPDPEKRRASFDINPHYNSKGELIESEGEEEEAGEGVQITVLDPANQFFSLAIRECQNRRIRSEGFPLLAVERKLRKRRPASFDFNIQMSDTSVSSPRSFVAGSGLKKNSAASAHSRSGMFPSPGTPSYRNGNGTAGYQKGWSSERVPLPANSARRYGSSTALLPLGNGRALPSKWEDAEKWICSPVSGDGVGSRQSALPPHHRRPKSKSGPLGNPARGGNGVCYSSASASPLVPGFDGGRVQNFTFNSPFMAGVLMADRGYCVDGSNGRGGSSDGCGGGGSRSYSAQSDHSMVRSASVHGWSDLLMESSSFMASSQDDKLGLIKGGATTTSSIVLRKDMATQMSPESSTHSSPERRPHPSSPPRLSHTTAEFQSPPPRLSHTIAEFQSPCSQLEVRDVQVDDRVTMTRWSKKHIAQGLDKNSSNIIQWKKKTVETRSSEWGIAETAKCVPKLNREEARITAWENLQKAKAEASIRKLEMKLEKKRSSSMDKILNKLRSAQRKSQEMRNAVTATQTAQVSTATKKIISFRRTGQMVSLSGCFTCHAF